MSIQLAAFIGVFVVLLLIGAPTYLSLLAAGLSYCYLQGGISDMMIMQKMFGSLDNFVFLAVPMFMLAGIIMNCGGITDRIFGFCRALLGHLRGGLIYVNIAASVLFSGMSGSALADVGGLGRVELKAMADEGYDDSVAIGITAASSTMGPIIPPSIPMVIYGSTASVSVGALFCAGIVPGMIIALVLSVTTYMIARVQNYPTHPRASLREIWGYFKRGFFALMMPVVIMGGIWCGYFTPTEASCIAIAYVLVVVLVIYKDMKISELFGVLEETVASVGPTMTIVSSAALFGWVLQFERLDKLLLDGMLALSTNKTVILLLLNVILLLFGMLMDSAPVIMLMVPVFLPLSRQLGIHEIHLGIIVVLNLMIGLMTPPVGQSLFILSGVTKKSFNEICRYTSPWLIPLLISLMIVTFCPDLVLWVPRALNMIA